MGGPWKTAPVRVCDIGGWTDTWFSRQGAVFNVPVYPGVGVRLVPDWRGGKDLWVWLDRLRKLYRFGDDGGDVIVDAVLRRCQAVSGLLIVTSAVPPGTGLGSSAAVIVALLRLLDESLGSDQLWLTAWEIESGLCNRQTGVQDHIAAAYERPTVSAIRYEAGVPHAEVTSVDLAGVPMLTFFARAPHEPLIHDQVISRSKMPEAIKAMSGLRALADVAAEAARSGDVETLGAVANLNTQLQYELHPALIPPWVCVIREVPGVLGVKVNGSGGSITVLHEPALLDGEALYKAANRLSLVEAPNFTVAGSC